MNLEDVERQLSCYNFEMFGAGKKRYVEESQVPTFVKTFNEFVKEYKTVPSVDALSYYYFNTQENDETIKDIIERGYKGYLMDRLARAYPSIVRDFHFTLLLKKHNLDVEYKEDDDVIRGIDHTIRYNGKTYFIHCLLKSKRSELYRKIKNIRHDYQGTHIDVYMDMNGGKKIGNVWLYTDEHVDELIKNMNKTN